MKGFVLSVFSLILMVSSLDTSAANRGYRKSKSNIYISKKYKGHNCPKPRHIINAKYF